jgi:hypothetical protein
MAMTGERIGATRVLGGSNGQFGSHRAFGVLGPRRERHNRAAKAKANGQRRTQDRQAIKRSLADASEALLPSTNTYEEFDPYAGCTCEVCRPPLVERLV